MYATFERFEIKMTLAQARSVSQPGKDAQYDVRELLKVPAIRRQVNALDAWTIIDELEGYGAWEDHDLESHAANIERIIWLAGCQIAEEHNLVMRAARVAS